MQMHHRPTPHTFHGDALPAFTARVRFTGPESRRSTNGGGEVDQHGPSATQARERVEGGVVVVPREECTRWVLVDPDFGVEGRVGAEYGRGEVWSDRGVERLCKGRSVCLEPIFPNGPHQRIAKDLVRDCVRYGSGCIQHTIRSLRFVLPRRLGSLHHKSLPPFHPLFTFPITQEALRRPQPLQSSG